jgi:hypothetical protein
MIILIPVLLFVFLSLLFYRLAQSDIFFGFCPEGQIKVIMRGKSRHRIIHSVQGYKLNENDELVPGSNTKGGPFMGGLYWIGIWPFYEVYRYKFQWKKMVSEEGKGDYIEKRNEWVNSLFFRYEYALEFKGLETSDNYKVDVQALINTQIFKPYFALFMAKQWLTVLSSQTEARLRDFIGGRTFDELRGMKSEEKEKVATGQSPDTKQGIVASVMSLNTTEGKDANICLEDLIGVKIVSFNLINIDAQKDAAVEEALKKLANTKRQKEADLFAATEDVKIAEQQAAKTKKLADAARYELEQTTMVAATNPAAAEIEAIKQLPKGLTALMQKGAVNVNIGKGDK